MLACLKRCIGVFVAAGSLIWAGDLRVAREGELHNEFQAYLRAQAERYWAAREQAIANVKSAADVRNRQALVRKLMLDEIGGLPAKTPLNPRITGSFTRDGYRVEKLVFESQPRFYVTANVYVPTNAPPPFPAVVGVAGHSNTGKAIDTYQYAWIGMVKQGFLVIAFDPPGQGERNEYLDPTSGKTMVPIGTRQHEMAGTQCLLTGTTFARYETWDGVRAVDYLLTRKDVDPKRIAVAGNSGGGTQSAYLAVFEPRLAAAVVSCYTTKWRNLWDKPGPQDAEQDFPGFVRDGMDFGDFLLAFAPKPITMLTATHDFFPIDGARATYAEAKNMYEAADAPGRVGFFEFDDEHGWSKPRREATYRWLVKWLQGKEEDGSEPSITPEPADRLNVTTTGQALTEYRGETVRSLNLKLAESMFPARSAAHLRNPAAMRDLIAKRLNVGTRSGAPLVSEVGNADPRTTKLLIQTEDGIHVPALLFAAESSGRHPAVVYVNGAGKAADMAAIDAAVAAGKVVLAIDPRGFGESMPAQSSGNDYSAEWQTAQRALLIGRPLVGMQVHDLLRSVDYLAGRSDVDASKIEVTGVGNGGVAALFAAALDPRISAVTVDGAVASYMTIVRADTHASVVGIAIPGVLRDFDLPDLAAAIAPRPLRIVGPRDATGKGIDRVAAEREFAPAAKRYRELNQAQKLQIEDLPAGANARGLSGHPEAR